MNNSVKSFGSGFDFELFAGIDIGSNIYTRISNRPNKGTMMTEQKIAEDFGTIFCFFYYYNEISTGKAW